MVVEYIRYSITEDKHQIFVKAYQAASKYLDGSEYCLGYELTQCEETPDSFILRIEWTSTEDHLNGFRKSVAFRSFLQHIRPFFNNIEEMKHYQLTTVVKSR